MGNEQSTPRAAGSHDQGFPATPTSPKGKGKSKNIFKRPKKTRRSNSNAPTTSSGSSGGPASVYEPQKVAIIGAGPVGALAALYFAKGGWQVTVYELRGDLRNPDNRSLNFTKSINLAISERGINGMRTVDAELAESILEDAIPMHGRMIHDKKGRQSSQKYDVHKRFIRSIDRSKLNERLLDELDRMNNVELKFNHSLRSLSLERNEAVFERKLHSGDYDTVRAQADLFIGADGAHSQTRRLMQKYVRMNFSQEYIDSLWCEFTIPPDSETGDYKLNPNHLHIWPRQTFMFIALPNQDRSFTCTLFMPEDMFKDIVGPEALLDFFRKEFPDVVELVGEENLIADYLKNQKLPLISVKCNPYHYRGKCVIVGDASHAMVPFYGQGMNCGFEDVRILWDHVCNDPTLNDALENYTAERHPDCVVINDLAMNNYVEMRASVTSISYLMKKGFQEFLYSWFPCFGVRTMYSMISFSNIRYSQVIKRVKRQEKVLSVLGTAIFLGGAGAGGYFAFKKGWHKDGMNILLAWKEELTKAKGGPISLASSSSTKSAWQIRDWF